MNINSPFVPIRFSKRDCEKKVIEISLNKEFPSIYKFIVPIKPLNKFFGFSTDHKVTAKLLSKIWNLTPVSELSEKPKLNVKYKENYYGRYIDHIGGHQLLSNCYTPFTIVKQALRWEYACQCAGTPFLPLHGVIIKWNGNCICFSGYGRAGKSYLADLIVREYPKSIIVVDDWCLINTKTRMIYRVGDTYLHVRGSALHGKSFQLNGGVGKLVELCEDDLCSEETRYLIKRTDLPSFYKGDKDIRLTTIVFIRNPFSEQVNISTTAKEIQSVLTSESEHFWDDSNFGLPEDILQEMNKKWQYLLPQLKAVVLDGHRRSNLSEIVRTKLAKMLST